MSETQTAPVLHVPARDIPVPSSVSPEAQATLSASVSATAPQPAPRPALEDVEAWRAMIKVQNEGLVLRYQALLADVVADVGQIDVGGVPVYVIVPAGVDADDPRTYLDVHGGALTHGAGEGCRAMGTVTAAGIGMRVWAVDYRMPPDHPFPTPLDDCVQAYRGLLREHGPEQIAVGGTSAGGNLAAALILRARDEGLPLPAAAVLRTPQLDLSESGDSFRTNLGVDTVLTRSLMPSNLLYAGGRDLRDPYISPLFGDFSKGFPPTLLTTGTRDLFLSNTVRMHRALRAAGVPAALHVLEAAPHNAFAGTAPEDRELDREVRELLREHLAR